MMDTDDDISTLGEEEATLSEATLTFSPDDALDSTEVSEADDEDEIDDPDLRDDDKLFTPLSESVPSSSLTLIDGSNEVKFQVMCARTHFSQNEKFVLYSVAIESGNDDDHPAILERRYNDFLSLYTSLRQSHPALMGRIKFPRKVIIGNFNSDVINERSEAFENFLGHVYGRDVLRCSEPFRNFLYRRDLRDSCRCLLHSQFEEAHPILENLFWLLDKLHGDRELSLRVLCQLIVSLHAINNYELSYKYSQLAIPKFQSQLNGSFCGELYVPFLHFCVRLWWLLGKDKRIFESKLEEARQQGKRVDGVPGLLDLLRDEISLPNIRA